MAQVLLVEDYPGIRQTYRAALVAAGHDVELAADGQEALEAVSHSSPDVILLDLLMPNMDGLEFLRRYRPHDHPHTKIIVFTNLASPELAKEALDLGASQYVIKSQYTPKAIAQLLPGILAQKT